MDIQALFGGTGTEGIVRQRTDDTYEKLDHLDLSPATIYAVLVGEANDAPDQGLALELWENGVVDGTISGGVLTARWPADTPELANLPSRVKSDATANVAIAIAKITDAGLIAAQATRRYRRQFVIRNTLPGTLTVSLAGTDAARLPIRYASGVANLAVPHGQYGVIDVDVWPTFALVRSAYLAGKDDPAIISFVLDGGGFSPTTSTFQPVLRQLYDPVIVVAHRTTAGNPALPAGKGYDARTEGGFTAGAHTVGVGGVRLAISADHGADGVFDNVGSFTNAAVLRIMALRGCDVHSVYVESGSSASLAWDHLINLPAGARVFGVTGNNGNLGAGVNPRPAGIDPITYYRGGQAGWSYEMFLTGVIEDFEPPAYDLGSSMAWFTVLVVVVPAG